MLVNTHFSRVVFCCLLTLVLSSCIPESTTQIESGELASNFNWHVPARLPLPIDPENNTASEEKFQLGRHLFYDRRLSGNGTQSCADCHQQALAFSDGLTLPLGSTGEQLARNSQSLINTSYNASYTWANTSLVRLEQQILIPLFGEDPIEQGINDVNREDVLETLRQETKYAQLVNDAFNEDISQLNYSHIVNALAVFTRGINSFDSPFDAYQEGDETALPASAIRGMNLFFGERFECFHCHGGYNFSDSTIDRTLIFFEKPFHNTGLYNIDGYGAYPENNTGIHSGTGLDSDMGKFRAPSLRNVALTAPYTHDGSVESLREMLEIYAAGGRVIETGEFAGDGRENPFKDGLITGFTASEQEFEDVISFLESLSDEDVISNPRFSNPWE